ncbi:glutamate--cysteine ligase [Mariprofundus ferrinatatus]|uniref:Glutamate--cysteine ligase n=1 Tax=Mariprofundus ferrinatatus TaxID=1921087 RepID=A0A2K8L706_9PROT|nr:glutamate--cysteine ligase [Mariprofundus ferrinatatus]ATX83023.1 glutamate--cysteine ligase [Mariprofundus ferrinatatus]
MTSRLTISDLANWFADGNKPRDQWRIGTEHEKVGFCMDTLKPIPYEGERSINSLLKLLSEQNWQPVEESGNIIALKKGLASITLEPGGQLELSGAPLATIHQTCEETTGYHRILKAITDELRIGFLAVGFQPKWQQADIPWMPKARYRVMRNYMPKVGSGGLDMMLRTATVQANLDFGSEADMARKMRISLCLQPLVTALYAASPFEGGKPSGFLSRRAACWLDTDPNRTGIPACAFEEDFGFAAYTEWALDAPMYFVIRNRTYIDCAGASFRDFLNGNLSQLPGEYPTMADWELHISTLFPDVRLKQYMEMRGADAGPWPWICSLPALWKGLLYDEQSQTEAWEMIADWSHGEVVKLRSEVPKTALATPFRETTALQLCQQMLEISRGGLERLNALNSSGENETIFLKPLETAIAAGQTQAEFWLNLYNGAWNRNIDRVFFEAMHN